MIYEDAHMSKIALILMILLFSLQWAPDRKGLFSGFIVAGFGGGSFIFNYIQTSYLNPRNKVARVEVNG